MVDRQGSRKAGRFFECGISTPVGLPPFRGKNGGGFKTYSKEF